MAELTDTRCDTAVDVRETVLERDRAEPVTRLAINGFGRLASNRIVELAAAPLAPA